MSFVSEADRIGKALAMVEGVKCVTRGWPSAMDEDTLPCIVVQKAGERGADSRDNREYLTEVEYYIRIFARKAGSVDAIAKAAQRELEDLGYERVFTWEAFDGDICRVDMRVRAYLDTDA